MKYDLVSGEWGEEYRYRNSDGDEIAFSLDPKIPFELMSACLRSAAARAPD